MKTLPTLNKLFPYEYMGGGYFRMKGYPKDGKHPAPILHGKEAIEFIYNNISDNLKIEQQDLHVTI